MSTTLPDTMLQLQSLVRPNGELEASLASVPVPMPADDEVLIRVEAAPINPSDLGLLFGPADLQTARFSGSALRPVVTAMIPEALRKNVAARVGQSMPVGNEGAGVVVRAGASPAAQALVGRLVAFFAGASHAQYRAAKVQQCLALPEGTTPAEGASSFVNPLTALSMVETMKREGHRALVHTAAASNLGQMLNRICLKDGVPLVNIVRKPEQVQLLRALGAQHVVDSSAPDFIAALTQALADSGATLAFDATGGGPLAGQILAAMESAINRTAQAYSRYGSGVHKQVYVYGGLERKPLEITVNFGTAWGVGGWLVTPFLQKIGEAAAQQLRERVAAEIRTTFASHYTRQMALAEALTPEAVGVYGRPTTGAKVLLLPNQGL